MNNKQSYRCNIPQDCSGNIISWKLNPMNIVALPSNSRPNPTPSSGRGTTQNGTKWSNYGVDPDLYAGGSGFICRRKGRTTCGGITGGFAPNPIRHWRKQLFPRQGGSTGISKVSTIQDRPGCAITLTTNQNGCFNHNFTEFYIGKTILDTQCDLSANTCFIKNMKKRSRPITTYSKGYHSSSNTYLQSRGKLFRQQSSINFKKLKNFNCAKSQPPPNYPGLYNSNMPGCFYDNSCVVAVVYDPTNKSFSVNSSVASGLYTRKRQTQTITTNQFNIINRWGLDNVTVTKQYPLIRNNRPGHIKYSGGTGQKGACCPAYIPPPPWLGEGYFIFELADSLWTDISNSVGSWYKAIPVISNTTPPEDIPITVIQDYYSKLPPTVWPRPPYITRVIVEYKYDVSDLSNCGFAATYVCNLLYYTGILNDGYDINIIQWGGIPLAWVDTGNFEAMLFRNSIDNTDSLAGTSNRWNGINRAITRTNADLPIIQWNTKPPIDTPRILPTSTLFRAFLGCKGLYNNNLGNIYNWEFENISTTYLCQPVQMFYGASNFDEDLTGWNTINFVQLYGIFWDCTSFTGKGIETWNLSNAYSVASMLTNCINFNANVSAWNFNGDINDARNVFQDCSIFEGKGIEDWMWYGFSPYIDSDGNLAVGGLGQTFLGCHRFEPEGSIGHWDVSNCTNFGRCFKDCDDFTGKGLQFWNLSWAGSITYTGVPCNTPGMYEMLTNCSSFNQNLMDWRFPKAFEGTVAYTFGYPYPGSQGALKNILNDTSMSVLNLTWTLVGWGKNIFNPLPVVGGQQGIGLNNQTFYKDKFGVYDLYNQNLFYNGALTTSVVPSYLGAQIDYQTYAPIAGLTNWSGAYYDNSGTSVYGTYPYDISGDSIVAASDFTLWSDDAAIVTNMSSMFINCNPWDGSGVATWTTTKLTNSSFMFQDCQFFNQYLTGWSMGKVTNTESMFQRCYRFTGLGIESWNVSNVVTAQNMFDMSGIVILSNWSYPNGPPWGGPPNANPNNVIPLPGFFNPNLQNWDVSEIINFQNMFRYNNNFEGNGLSNWDTAKANSFEEMFNNCYAFNENIGSWQTANLNNMAYMVTNTLFNQDLGSWSIQSLQDASSAFNDCSLSIPNYTNILVGWGFQPLINLNVDLGANLCYYYHQAIAPRANLTNNYFWIIDDLGPFPPTDPSLAALTDWSQMWLNGVGNTQNLSLEPYPPSIVGLVLHPDSEFSHWAADSSNVTTMEQTFKNCSNIYLYGVEDWIVTDVSNFNSMFYGCSVFNQDISVWDLSAGWLDSSGILQGGANDMENMFYGCTNFNHDLSWNVSTVTTMQGMFYWCRNFNSDLTNWNVSNVTNMRDMFNTCENFDGDLGGWNLSSVTDMEYMFVYCTKFTGKGVENWNVSQASGMAGMFFVCTVFNADLSAWHTPLNNSMYRMFWSCPIFTGTGLENWTTSQVTDMRQAFRYDTLFNGNIGSWDTTTVTQMDAMLNGCVNFDQDLSGWIVPNLSSADQMLDNCGMSTQNYTLLLRYWADNNPSLNSGVPFGAAGLKYYQWARSVVYATNTIIPVPILDSSWGWVITDAGEDTEQIGYPPSIANLTTWANIFNGGIGDPTTLVKYIDVRGYDISGISSFDSWINNILTSVSRMFKDCSDFEGIGLSNWNTTSLQNMDQFLQNAINFNQDLNGWNIENVTSMKNAFNNCTSWNGNGVQYWHPKSVTDMDSVFKGCTKFNQDLTGWRYDVSSIIYADGMFSGCVEFTGEGLSLWDTSGITSMQSMFYNDFSFNQNLSTWNISQLQFADNMLDNCGMSTNNFSNLLIGWAAQAPNIKSYVNLGAAYLSYNGPASTSYIKLTSSPYYWTIDSSGQTIFPIPASIATLTNWSGMFIGGIGNPNNNPNYTAVDGVIIYPTTNFVDWSSAASNVTEFVSMFEDCSGWQGLGLSTWDMSSVVQINNMFNGCDTFNQDLTGWGSKVSAVDNFSTLFQDCSSFVGTGLSTWDVSNALSFKGMFNNCTQFNQDLRDWNISKLMDASDMLSYSGMSTQNYSLLLWGWRATGLISGVQPSVTLDAYGIEYYSWAESARSALIAATWIINDAGEHGGAQPGFPPNIAALTDWSFMFDGGIGNALYPDIEGYVVTAISDFSEWKPDAPPAVLNMEAMFRSCEDFVGIGLEKWKTPSVTDLSGMFQDCSNLLVDLSGWCENPTVETMNSMFKGCTIFDSNLKGWQVQSLTNASGMLDNCNMSTQNYSELLWFWSIDVSNASPPSPTPVLFGATGLYYYPWPTLITYINDLLTYGWTITDAGIVDGATSMAGVLQSGFPPSVAVLTDWSDMFSWGVGSTSEPDFIDISGYVVTASSDFTDWNSSEVVDMSGMFANCSNFVGIGLSKWNVSNVTNMTFMFDGDSSFNQDLSGWNVENVTGGGFSTMFLWCTDFEGTGLSTWKISDSVTNLYAMFYNTPAFNADLSLWNVRNVTNMYTLFFSSSGSFTGAGIGAWNVGSVQNFSNMLSGQQFNVYLGNWNVSSATDMTNMFYSCQIFDSAGLENWNPQNVTIMLQMFYKNYALTNADFGSWNVSNNTNLKSTFGHCYSFLGTGLKNWNTEKVTTMHGLFYADSSFNEDLTGWNVSKVENMFEMFYDCTIFNQDLSGWNINAVTDITDMFQSSEMDNSYNINTSRTVAGWLDTKNSGASGDPAIVFSGVAGWPGDLYNFSYVFLDMASFVTAGQGYPAGPYGNVSDWNVSRVTDMTAGFQLNLTINDDLNLWDTASVTNMTYMFNGATAFNSNLSFNTSKVTNMIFMFAYAAAFNKDVSFNTSSVTTMEGMFLGATSFNKDLSFNTSSVTNMSNMFQGATSFNSDLSFNTSSVTNMSNMFLGATSFNKDLSFNTSSVTNMSNMFQGATSFNSDLSFNTSSVTTMEGMFVNAIDFNGDISGWNTESVTNMSFMFNGASSFNQDLSWNTEKVTDMFGMFSTATSFTGDISGWNTGNVTNMVYMFYLDSSFNSDISGWNVSKVENMYAMFYGASSFNQDLSDWDMSSITSGGNIAFMFTGSGVPSSGTNNDAIYYAWLDVSGGWFTAGELTAAGLITP